MSNPQQTSTEADLVGQKLRYAVLHSELFFPGVGQLGKTLTTEFNPLTKPVDMTYIGNNLVLLKVKNSAGKLVKFLVSTAQFTHMVLADE
jgi:hypothetical protein